MQFLIKKIKNKSAQAMVEFAFVLPVLLIVLAFIFDGAQLLFAKQVAQNAAYNGCRIASVQNSYDTAKNEAKNKMKETLKQGFGLSLMDESEGHYNYISIENDPKTAFPKAQWGHPNKVIQCNVKAKVSVLLPFGTGKDVITNQVAMIKEFEKPKTGTICKRGEAGCLN